MRSLHANELIERERGTCLVTARVARAQALGQTALLVAYNAGVDPAQLPASAAMCHPEPASQAAARAEAEEEEWRGAATAV